MDVSLKYVRVRDQRLWDHWNRGDRWDFCGALPAEITDRLELVATVDGEDMTPAWTAEALKQGRDCHCGDCAGCQIADEAEAVRRLPVAA